MEPRSEVLRLGHRPGRDDRLTTHVGLTARAFGADGVTFDGTDDRAKTTAEEVTERFGGSFEASMTEEPRRVVREWGGPVVHLSMYGLPVQDEVDTIRTEATEGADDGPDGVLVVVGSEKVPGWVYGAVDHNVGVTNQPHSEVAALAVFLHELYGGDELDADFSGGEIEVVPSERGKTTRELED